GDDVGANSDQGSVRIFVRSGTAWTAQATLTASDGAPFDYLGEAVSLDGDTLAVGVGGDDIGTNAEQGSVRMFVRVGTAWLEQATLADSSGAATEQFGYSVALSGDTLATGVVYDTIGTLVATGSTRIFGNYRVLNDTTDVGYSSLASAVFAASSGNRLIVGNASFSQADDVIDASQKPLVFMGVEPLPRHRATSGRPCCLRP
ncbi:MAG: FG-GAP repeat protein, partial [Phycisphaerales bacterium]